MNPTCLSYWYPKIAGVVPTPETRIIPWRGPSLIALLDGETPEGFDDFLEELDRAAQEVAAANARRDARPPYPTFLRTGLTSGKHDWENCCHVPSREVLGRHVFNIVEFSFIADLVGLATDFWAVRELLPTEPVATLPWYGNFPLVREWRAFVDGGEVVCVHPYWPPGATEQGGARGVDFVALDPTAADRCVIESRAGLAGAAVGGAWSVDVLAGADGVLYVTDTAEAHKSFYWPGCPENRWRAESAAANYPPDDLGLLESEEAK